MKISDIIAAVKLAAVVTENAVALNIDIKASEWRGNGSVGFRVWHNLKWIDMPSLDAAMEYINGLGSEPSTAGSLEDDTTTKEK